MGGRARRTAGWGAAALVAAPALACASAAGGGAPGGPVPAAAPPGPDAPASAARALHRLVPEDALTLLYLDHERLGRPAWLVPAELAARHRAERGFAEDAEVARELQAALPALDGEAPANLSAFAGQFERELLRGSALGRQGARDHRDVAVWGPDGLDAPALALARSGLALFGPRAAVQAALDLEAGRGRAVTTTDWYRATERALAALWSPAQAPALELRARITAEERARLSGDEAPLGELDWLAARVALDRGLTVRVTGGAASPERARAVAGWARAFLLDLAETPTVAQLGLAPLLRGSQVGAGARACGDLASAAAVVCWRLDVSPEQRDLLMQRMERLLQAVREAGAR